MSLLGCWAGCWDLQATWQVMPPQHGRLRGKLGPRKWNPVSTRTGSEMAWWSGNCSVVNTWLHLSKEQFRINQWQLLELLITLTILKQRWGVTLVLSVWLSWAGQSAPTHDLSDSPLTLLSNLMPYTHHHLREDSWSQNCTWTWTLCCDLKPNLQTPDPSQDKSSSPSQWQPPLCLNHGEGTRGKQELNKFQ